MCDDERVGGNTLCLVHVERALVDVPHLRVVSEVQQDQLAQDRHHGPKNASRSAKTAIGTLNLRFGLREETLYSAIQPRSQFAFTVTVSV